MPLGMGEVDPEIEIGVSGACRWGMGEVDPGIEIGVSGAPARPSAPPTDGKPGSRCRPVRSAPDPTYRLGQRRSARVDLGGATMAQTQTTDEPIYIPTLDEIDRMAQIDPQTRLSKLDPQARLAARLDAHQVITAQRELVAQGVRS